MTKIFRIDDIGASTKHFNQHGKKRVRLFGCIPFYFPFANVWFFKRMEPFRGWAVYDELTKDEWGSILAVFAKHRIVPVVAITATWVERGGTLVPFHEKFPEEAQLLKRAFMEGKIIVANHGLTHCVVGKHRPRFWSSNRKFHREFLPALDESWHREHIAKSQEILENFFEKPVEILVPPGNMWSVKTYKALHGSHLKKVMCGTPMLDSDAPMEGVQFIKDNNEVVAFHDRELKLYGVQWLEQLIKKHHD